MQAFGIREGELKPLKNNSWDQETPGLLLICNNMELLQLQGSFGFDDGTIEECMTIDDYARFESFETYDFITVNYFFYEGEKLIFEEIDLYIGTDYLVLILNNEQLRSELLARLQKGRRARPQSYAQLSLLSCFRFYLGSNVSNAGKSRGSTGRSRNGYPRLCGERKV